MALTIKGGWLDGHLVRKARKHFICDGKISRLHGGKCKSGIAPGAYYAEGFRNDDAGGFAVDRLCFDCAGHEAFETVPMGALAA